MSREHPCPNCGNTYTSIGQHWVMSSSCSHPEFTPTQREILTGLMLSGAASIRVASHTNTNADICVSSTNRKLLSWVQDEFGVLGRDVRQRTDAETVATQFASTHADSTTDDYEYQDVYEWSTRTHPSCALLRARWYDESGEKRVPPGLTPTPLSMAVVYALRGRCDTFDEKGQMAIVSLGRVIGSPAFWERFLAPFDAQVTKHSTPQLRIRDTAGFFDFLADRDPSDPLPGCDEKWPEADAPLATVAPTAERCPSCGGRFERLSLHWSSGDCEAPSIPERLTETLKGALLVGGSVVPKPTGSPCLRFASTDEPRIYWLDTELGMFSRGVERHEPQEEEMGAGFREAVGGDAEFSDVFVVHSRYLPQFESWRSDWYSGGAKAVPEDIARSPELLRAAYISRGNLEQHTGSQYRKVVFPVTTVAASDEFWEELFAPFDPTVYEKEDGRRIVYLNDVEAFFDYIGDAPTPDLQPRWRDSG